MTMPRMKKALATACYVIQFNVMLYDIMLCYVVLGYVMSCIIHSLCTMVGQK